MKKGKGQDPSNKGKPRSAGKSKAKTAAYFANSRLTKKKIRRMLRSNGTKQAKAYAEERGQAGFFLELERSGLVARIEQRKKIKRARQAAHTA